MKPKFTIEIFNGGDGQFYAHAIHRNGNIIIDFAEGYTTRAKIKKSMKNFIAAVQTNDFLIVDTTSKNSIL